MSFEIGSEFHKLPFETGTGLNLPCSGSFVFSGRTALAAVLQKIKKCKRALVPSYCCNSMLEPFINAGITLDYYHVYYDNGLRIDLDKYDDIDVILWCNYFGYKQLMPDLSPFLKRGGIIIEDITHSLFSKNVYHKQSDYLIGSIRKWEPIICGGFASIECDFNNPPREFINIKFEAMNLKEDYFTTSNKTLKDRYLLLFKESNQWLANNYTGLSIDDYSLDYIKHVDVEKQRSIRRRNASVLYEGLGDAVQFMFPEDSMDCPLFVPIILNGKRDYVRQHLIDNDIYCPVHWPHPAANCESNLYNIELSLICDQRYNEIDMERIVSVVKEAL